MENPETGRHYSRALSDGGNAVSSSVKCGRGESRNDSTEVFRRGRVGDIGMVANRMQLILWAKESRDGEINGRLGHASAYLHRCERTPHAFPRLKRSSSTFCTGGSSGAWLGTVGSLHDSHRAAIDRRLSRLCASLPHLRL